MIKIYLKQNPQIKNDISDLYISAFPENERPPLEWFYRNVYFYKKNEVIGYYDNDEFVGFAYLVFFRNIVYIAYLAVTENKRNQGYGTKILNDIKESYPKHTKLLCFEEVDTKYSDYQNRLNRQNFYLRNGYIDNNLKTREGKVIYQSAYIGNKPIDFKTYKCIFDHTYGKGANERYLREVL